MTTNESLYFLTAVAIYGSVVPVLLAAWKLLQRPAVQRAAAAWMAVSMGSNLYMRALRIHDTPNNILTEFSLGLKALIIIYVIGELLRSERSRRLLYLALAAFLGLWIWRGFAGDFLLAFSQFTQPAYYLLLTVASAVLLLERIGASVAAPFRDFGLLLGLATIVTYAPTVAITALSQMLWQENEALVRLLWIPRQLLLLVGLVFYSLAFAWNVPSRSSSGSSASAA